MEWSMHLIRVVIVATFVLCIIQLILTIIAMVTTEWFTSDTIHVGLASGCSPKHVGGLPEGITVTYCDEFSLAALSGNREKAMAVMMILCVVLEVAAAYNLIFALCARLGRTNYLILLLSFFLLLATMILFAVQYSFEPPYGTHVGYSYYTCMLAAAVALLNMGFCRWVTVSQKWEYQRLD